MFLGRINSQDAPQAHQESASDRRQTHISKEQSENIGAEQSQKRPRPPSIEGSQQDNISKRQKTDRDFAEDDANIGTFNDEILMVQKAESLPFDISDQGGQSNLQSLAARKQTVVNQLASHDGSPMALATSAGAGSYGQFGQHRQERAMTSAFSVFRNTKEEDVVAQPLDESQHQSVVTTGTKLGHQEVRLSRQNSNNTRTQGKGRQRVESTGSSATESFVMERQSASRSRRASRVSSSGSAFGGMQRSKETRRRQSPYSSVYLLEKGEKREDSAGNKSATGSAQLQRDAVLEEADKSSEDASALPPLNREAADLLASSRGESGDDTSNDYESSLIQSSVSSYKINQPPALPGASMVGAGKLQGDVYQKLTCKSKANYLQIEAVWVLDQSKRVNVEVTMDDQVSFLQSKIGERMEETYDDFRGLRHVVASHVYGGPELAKPAQQEGHLQRRGTTQAAGSRAPHQTAIELLRSAYSRGVSLDPNIPVSECLKDGEMVYFQIETMDLWINTDIHLSLMGRPVLQGKAQFKVSKNSTFAGLRKKLQIFGIKLWCHKNRQPNADQSEYQVTQLSGNAPGAQETEKPTADEYLEGDGGPFGHKDEVLGTGASVGTVIEHDGELLFNRDEMPKGAIDSRISTKDVRFESVAAKTAVEETALPEVHLLYSVDKFELKSQFRTQSPKVDVAIRTSVGVEGVTVTHFVSNEELKDEKGQLQQSIQVQSLSQPRDSIVLDGFNETQQSESRSQLCWDLQDIDELEQIGTLFDYRNQLVMKMDFIPYMQLNTAPGVARDLPNDIQQLRGLKTADYPISNQAVRVAFDKYIRRILTKSPFSCSFGRSAQQDDSIHKSEQLDSGLGASMHNNLEILIGGDGQLDQRDQLGIPFGSHAEEEAKTPPLGFGTSVENESKKGHQLIQLANLAQLSSLHEQNQFIKSRGDEDVVLTEGQEDLPEQANFVFGIRDLLQGRITTDKQLAVLNEQQYSQTSSTSMQAIELMKQELLHLKIQFLTHVQQNYERIYVWRLNKMYEQLVQDVLDCTFDKQVIARSQAPEVQNKFTAVVQHAKRAQIELEQALQVLVDIANGADRMVGASKDSKDSAAYFGGRKPAMTNAGGEGEERASHRSKSQKQSPVTVTHRLGGAYSARSKLDGLLFAGKHAEPERSRQNSFHGTQEIDIQEEAEAASPFRVQGRKAGDYLIDLENPNKDSATHLSRHSSALGQNRGSELEAGRFSFAGDARQSTPVVKDDPSKKKTRNSGIIAKMFKTRSSKALETKQAAHAASPGLPRGARLAAPDSPEFTTKHLMGGEAADLRQTLLSKLSSNIGTEEPLSTMVKTKSAFEPQSSIANQKSFLKAQPPSRKTAKSIHLLERGVRGSKETPKELMGSSNEKERPANFQEQFISIFKKRPARQKHSVHGAARDKNAMSLEGCPRGESAHLPAGFRPGPAPLGLGQLLDPRTGGKKPEETVSPECLIALIKLLAQIQMVHSTFKDKKIKTAVGTAPNWPAAPSRPIRKRTATAVVSKAGAPLLNPGPAAKDEKHPASPASHPSHPSQRPLTGQVTRAVRKVSRKNSASWLETESPARSPRGQASLSDTMVHQAQLVSKEDFEHMKLPQIRKLNFKHTGRNLWQITENLQYLNKLKLGLINIDFALERKPEKQQPSNHNMFRNLFHHQSETPQTQTYSTSTRTRSWQLPTFGQPLNPQQVFNTEQLGVLNNLQSTDLAQAGYLAMINEITKEDQKKLTMKQLESIDQRTKLLGQHLPSHLIKDLKDIPFDLQQFKTQLNMEKTIKKRKIMKRRLKIVVGLIFVLIVAGIVAAITWLIKKGA